VKTYLKDLFHTKTNEPILNINLKEGIVLHKFVPIMLYEFTDNCSPNYILHHSRQAHGCDHQ